MCVVRRRRKKKEETDVPCTTTRLKTAIHQRHQVHIFSSLSLSLSPADTIPPLNYVATNIRALKATREGACSVVYSTQGETKKVELPALKTYSSNQKERVLMLPFCNARIPNFRFITLKTNKLQERERERDMDNDRTDTALTRLNPIPPLYIPYIIDYFHRSSRKFAQLVSTVVRYLKSKHARRHFIKPRHDN